MTLRGVTPGVALGVVPRIPTARLVLRGYEVRDFEPYAANVADPLAIIPGQTTFDRRTAWRVFTATQGQWMLHGAGWWALEHAATGAFVGTVGAFFRENSPELEIGWTVVRAHWKNGYASEAAAAALAWAFETHRPERVIAHIANHNAASIGVSRKLGMRYDAEVPFYDESCSRYIVDRV